MKLIYTCELILGVSLVGVVEVYFWTQGRTFLLDNPMTKIAVLALYVILAVVSQAALCWKLRIRLKYALEGNLLVAAIVATGLTGLGFLVHPAVLKDVPVGWTNLVIASAKFFATIGVATLALRISVASIVCRTLRNGPKAPAQFMQPAL